MLIGAAAVVVLGLTVVLALRGSFASEPWPAVVTSVDHGLTCTGRFTAEATPGGPNACVGDGENESGRTLRVGDCVEMNIHHPTLVIERAVPCPEPLPAPIVLRRLAIRSEDCRSIVTALRLEPSSSARDAVEALEDWAAYEPGAPGDGTDYRRRLLAAITALPATEPIGDAFRDVPCA